MKNKGKSKNIMAVLDVFKDEVEAHKGRVWAQSEGTGKGSTFYVELDAVA